MDFLILSKGCKFTFSNFNGVKDVKLYIDGERFENGMYLNAQTMRWLAPNDKLPLNDETRSALINIIVSEGNKGGAVFQFHGITADD